MIFYSLIMKRRVSGISKIPVEKEGKPRETEQSEKKISREEQKRKGLI